MAISPQVANFSPGRRLHFEYRRERSGRRRA